MNLVNRYQYLVKSKTKALGVFNKALAGLQQVITDIETEKKACQSSISKSEQRIMEEKEAFAYLNAEHVAALETVKKIEHVIGA